MDLKETSKAVRTLIDILGRGPCPRATEKQKPCMCAEDDRELTAAEKRKGWSQRPFFAYDPDRMCPTCAAYWHAAMAGLALDRAVRLEAMENAEKENRR